MNLTTEIDVLDSVETDESVAVECKVGRDEKVEVIVASAGSERPEVFKKPVFLGPRRGKPVGKVRSIGPISHTKDEMTVNENSSVEPGTENKQIPHVKEENVNEIHVVKESVIEEDAVQVHKTQIKGSSAAFPAPRIKDLAFPLPYKEPNWGGDPESAYSFEVLKSGKILENINLSTKSFFVFGRLTTCDIHLAHPTISRYHAVLQYRSQADDDNCPGFYIYDLGSTHGTFLNKYRIKPKMYVRVQVGHMVKLGCSTRMFLMQGPPDDMEQESDLTVSELQEKRRRELLERELEKKQKEQAEEERKKKEEEEGVDWGMGEDADEETDLSENPFAATNNEELYIDDPKKTLRGWFEREGYELEYDVEEKGFSQFLCRVELPVDSAKGGTMVAEAMVKGKKKEAVAQCALEACRILDRYGILRQATHESRKRKVRNWEDDDFYDSDEDTFLDRTGAVENKRQQRMAAAGKVKTEVETYDSLRDKHQTTVSRLHEVEIELQTASHEALQPEVDPGDEEDALDAFMSHLKSAVPDKTHISKLKAELAWLKQEEVRLRQLVNITRPASLPELTLPHVTKKQVVMTGKKAALLPGVKKKSAVQSDLPDTIKTQLGPGTEAEAEEEEDDDDDDDDDDDGGSRIHNIASRVEEQCSTSNEEKKNTSHKFKGTGGSGYQAMDRFTSTQKRSMIGPTLPDSLKVSKPDSPILLQEKQLGHALPQSGKEIEDSNVRSLDSEDTEKYDGPCISVPELDPEEILDEKEIEKRRKRNRRRLQQRVSKETSDKVAKYNYDTSDPDYSVWLPPEGQTGDGKTKLNEKYGY